MTDSEKPDERADPDVLDALERKHERNREARNAEIKRWAEYVKENPAAVWGEQLNALIEAQLESARESGLSADHYGRLDNVDEGSTGSDGPDSKGRRS